MRELFTPPKRLIYKGKEDSAMKKIISIVIVSALVLTVLTACVGKNIHDGIAELDKTKTPAELGADGEREIDYSAFSFALEWGVNGDSTYDSTNGTLIKQKIATNLDEFTTTLTLFDEQVKEAYDILSVLDFSNYPDGENYEPSKGMSSPCGKLVLTVRSGDVSKTITANRISLDYVGKDKDAQAFLDACSKLQELIRSTPEWQSLPEYEFLYD